MFSYRYLADMVFKHYTIQKRLLWAVLFGFPNTNLSLLRQHWAQFVLRISMTALTFIENHNLFMWFYCWWNVDKLCPVEMFDTYW